MTFPARFPGRCAACDERICLAPRTEPFEVAVRVGRTPRH